MPISHFLVMSSLQIVLTAILIQVSFAHDSKAQELLSRRVNVSVSVDKKLTGGGFGYRNGSPKEVPAPNLVNQLKGWAAGVFSISNGSRPGSQGQSRSRGNCTLTTSQPQPSRQL